MRIGQSAKVTAVDYVGCLCGAAIEFAELAENHGKERTAAEWAVAFKGFLKGANFKVRPPRK